MQYKGIELVEIMEPQIFNPPKKMLVWNDLSQKPKEAYVVAIIPNCSAYGNMKVIGPYGGVGSGYNSEYPTAKDKCKRYEPKEG